ncbi:MAG: D-TA family PLP-dependent enzyme [Gemmataceae bacterium]|nr:D-TA family PLP-dependent enzyme [Gemmataceae bacterium]
MPAVPKTLEEIPSPSLLFFVEEIAHNLKTALDWVGNNPDRLRLHVKTHKCPEIIKGQIAKGITRFKTATLAEAEMAAKAGASDVLIAFPMVGPNISLLVSLIKSHPGTAFSVTVDHPEAAQALGGALHGAGLAISVLLDIDMGMKRTGFPAGHDAIHFYRTMALTPGLKPIGFHTYDGHNQHESLEDRKKELQPYWDKVIEMKRKLDDGGFPVHRIVAGGTPTFALYKEFPLPGLECSPGTIVLHDFGYGNRFKELAPFKYGAGLLTRVISKPAAGRLTTDLGYKAVSGDQPPGKRCIFPHNPDLEPVGHSEEHLMLSHPNPDSFRLGEPLLAIPTHICPTVALHQWAYAISNGEVKGMWEITGRYRGLQG